MFDAPARKLLAPPLEATGKRLAAAGVRPLVLTGAGWLMGVAACVSVAEGAWTAGLALWLGNRILDGLDGPVARASGCTDSGGFLDIVADFSIYGGFVVALAVAIPAARMAALALFLAYYVSGTAFLALSSLLERRRAAGLADGRSLRFVGGLAEGGETIVAYSLICLVPSLATQLTWAFAALVAVTALQRVLIGVSLLRAVPWPYLRQSAAQTPANPAELRR